MGSNNEYEHQSNWLDNKWFKKQQQLMLQDLILYGSCAYHYPSFKRIDPLTIIEENNIYE